MPSVAALAIGLVLAAGCGRSEPEQPIDLGVIAVTTSPARPATLRDSITVPGTITPLAAADFVVTAPEPAEIVELPKNEGDLVKAGEVVVRLDVPAISTEIATRQLELAEVTLRVDRARAEADRLGDLFQKGLAARNQWEASRAVLSAAETALTGVRARLDTARTMEATTIIRARFDGVVSKRWHNVGDRVVGGDADPILRIVDPSRLQISATVPTVDAARIQPGQATSVQTLAGIEPGIVALKLASSAPGATTVDVRMNFLTPTTLPIDTAVQVEIAIEERKDVLAVPAGAIQRLDTSTFVWIVNEDSQATRRDVRLGLIVGNLAQIVSGLNAGDQVVVTGIAQLNEGTPVTIGK